MAKEGPRVMHSDLHTMEPPTLLEGYLDEEFKKFIPSIGGKTPSPPKQPANANGRSHDPTIKGGIGRRGRSKRKHAFPPSTYAVARKTKLRSRE